MTPEDNLAFSAFAILMLIASILAILIIVRLERLLNRYRLKYGFDREIESKECSKVDTEEKLNRRERLFKRTVFKD